MSPDTTVLAAASLPQNSIARLTFAPGKRLSSKYSKPWIEKALTT
jgi:hypothetical protein